MDDLTPFEASWLPVLREMVKKLEAGENHEAIARLMARALAERVQKVAQQAVDNALAQQYQSGGIRPN
jgi:hypothetical protein